jgi:hypothetical protein
MKANPPRTIGAFEARSLILFASLALGGAASSMAQPVREPTARSVSVSTAEKAAFDRADRNQDGQLSVAEAESLPVIASRLRELDTDGNGSLSRAEFHRGAQQ